MAEFSFFDTEVLTDGEILLMLDKTVPGNPAEEWLPSYHFRICDREGHKVGHCDLRIGHNGKTYYGGNIGYGVEEPYRGNHYAGKACRLLFHLAKRHGMDDLIITCNPDNFPSRRTCEYVGGVLKEIVELPQDNDMRLEGETEKCIYEVVL
ncbi:MAG: GNAT family N-acetyltransferase [Lachnospiraceae bacterium]|nr:GNAT family N-acetyltransferase [Lachnospiraceae bacterium]